MWRPCWARCALCSIWGWMAGVRAGAEVPPHLVEAVEALAQGPCPELGKPLYGETFGHYS